MKGIYLTKECVQVIEAKIHELNDLVKSESFGGSLVLQSHIDTYKEILSSATILPVEESWDFQYSFPPDNESQKEWINIYKNGVIIQPKS